MDREQQDDAAMDAISISIVIPAFREREVVGQVVNAVVQVVEPLGLPFEVIVVDDASDDGTGDVAEEAGARVIRHPYNRGYGAGLKSGIRAARGHTIVTLDADGQHSPTDIPRLLAQRASSDMVVGARRGWRHSPIWRHPGKRVLSWLASYLAERSIPDFNSGFRVIDRELALRLLPILPNGFSFSTTITLATIKAGHTVTYVPVDAKRRSGRSSVRLSDGLNTALLMLRLISLFAPLRIFIPFSLSLFILGIVFTIANYVDYDRSNLKGFVAIISSFLSLLIGLLADQVAALRRGEHVGVR
jgi:glycosyltransferase involved in cell wall biosynthesis